MEEGSWFSFPALDNLLWERQPPIHPAQPFGTYFGYAASSVGKCRAERGDRVILPPSALRHLVESSPNPDSPMLFQLRNPATDFATHCGVLEFCANEGTAYLPLWIMQSLMLENGDVVRVKSVALPKATFVRLQPHKAEFFKISDMKRVLESILRDFSCLTVGQSILIFHNDKEYELEVVEAKPSSAVCTIDTDCEVEFAKPLDATNEKPPPPPPPPPTTTTPETSDADAHKETIPPSSITPSQPRKAPIDHSSFKPFTGVSRRLDGKPTTSSPTTQKSKNVRFS